MYQECSDDVLMKSRLINKGLKTVCLESDEKLFLANSQGLVKMIMELGLIDYYPSLSTEARPNP